ncbi:helix-turn-helix domain of resolvase [Leptospira interrogans serovar Bataviae str. HAI135]|nr:helix-turn-helix domain of resolvase [Leptospira interrogans serovar Bataviae str. HAI135]
MKKILQWIPHSIVLCLLSVAEGSRLFEFYRMLSGNALAGIASAGITVGIVFYLALYGYRNASRWATALCVLLSLASFVQPLKNEYIQEDKARPIKELLGYPTYNPKAFWNGGRETYVETYRLETERIKKQNELILLQNAEITSSKELSLYFWHLLLGALVLAVCVPVLNYLVSHKIADMTEIMNNNIYHVETSPTHRMRTVVHEEHYPDNRVPVDNSDKATERDSLQKDDKTIVVSHGYSRTDDKDDSGDKPTRQSGDMTNRNAEIRRLYDAHVPAPEISKIFGISRQQVYKILTPKKHINKSSFAQSLRFA